VSRGLFSKEHFIFSVLLSFALC